MPSKQQLEDYAKTFTRGFMREMMNVDHRGPNFTWEGFPEMAAKTCQVSVFTNFSEQDQPTEEQKDATGEMAREYALKLIESGYNCPTHHSGTDNHIGKSFSAPCGWATYNRYDISHGEWHRRGLAKKKPQ